MARLILPSPLAKFANNQKIFESNGSTVQAVIQELLSTYEDLKKHVINDAGDIRSYIRIYVGEDDIKTLQNEHTPVRGDEIISIIPAIAGG